MVRDAFCTFLQSPSDNGGLVIDLTNDKDRTNHTGGETLQDDGLIIIDGYLGAIVGEGYRIGGRRGIIGLWGRWWWCINASCRLIHINDIHDERI